MINKIKRYVAEWEIMFRLINTPAGDERKLPLGNGKVNN